MAEREDEICMECGKLFTPWYWEEEDDSAWEDCWCKKCYDSGKFLCFVIGGVKSERD